MNKTQFFKEDWGILLDFRHGMPVVLDEFEIGDDYNSYIIADINENGLEHGLMGLRYPIEQYNPSVMIGNNDGLISNIDLCLFGGDIAVPAYVIDNLALYIKDNFKDAKLIINCKMADENYYKEYELSAINNLYKIKFNKLSGSDRYCLNVSPFKEDSLYIYSRLIDLRTSIEDFYCDIKDKFKEIYNVSERMIYENFIKSYDIEDDLKRLFDKVTRI